ncbi:MAG: c-type cytochrome [Thiotrichales bacterium]
MKKLVMASMATLALGMASTAALADGAAKFGVCAGCHGQKGEMKALGVSPVIAGESKEDIAKKLHGYKDGSYGGAMKSVMAGQVASLSDADIEELATYISGL